MNLNNYDLNMSSSAAHYFAGYFSGSQVMLGLLMSIFWLYLLILFMQPAVQRCGTIITEWAEGIIREQIKQRKGEVK